MGRKVKLPKSNVIGKTPSATTMEFGELYVNYAAGTGNSFLVTKKNDGSLAKFPESASVVNALSNKVDEVEGKGLSTNDYTTTEKNKLAGIESGAEVNVQADWSETGTTSDAYIKNKPTIPTVNNSTITIQKNGSTVKSFTLNQATGETINITVPTNVNELTNGSGYITTADTKDFITSAVTKLKFFATSSDTVTALNGKQNTINDLAKIRSDAASGYSAYTGLTAHTASASHITSTERTNWNNKQSAISDLATIRNNASSGYSAYTGLTAHTVSASHITSTERTNWNNKVDKVSGKGLSTNDFNNAYKGKLDGIASGAEVNVQSDWNVSDSNSDAYIKNKPTIPTVNNSTITIQKNGTDVDSFTLNQSSNKTINIPVPTNVNELTNGSGFITSGVTAMTNYATSANVVTALNKKPDVAFKTIAIGTTNIVADSNADTLTITAGNNITLTPNSTNDSITIAATNTTYTAATATPMTITSATGVVGTSDRYAREDHKHQLTLATGDANGQVKIGGTNVSVKGLGSAAYTNSSAYVPTGRTVNGKNLGSNITLSANDVSALTNTTKYAASIDLTKNNTTFQYTWQLKDQDGNNLGTAQTLDLPIESVVVGGKYIASAKTVQLVLQSGSTIEFSIADLVSGLQTEITSTNKLSADLIQNGTTNKVYTATEQTKLSGIEANAQKNGNAYKTIKVGNTSMSAGNSGDTFSISAGTNITLTTGTNGVKISAPSNVSAFSNDAGYITSTATNLSNYASSASVVSALGNKPDYAFKTIKVAGTDIVADAKEDTLTITAGANIGLVPNATNDSFIISATDTTYSDATTSVHGLMSVADKKKLNGIASGAQVNVQSDWSVTATTNDAYIKNKPTIPSAGTASPKNVASTSAVGTSVKYAREDHQHKIEVATGDANGQVKIAGQNVDVKGLGSAAYTESSAYATASHNQALSTITGADDLKAIEDLAGTSGLLKKTAANTWSLDTTKYIASGNAVTALNNKVDKVANKGLSTNDYTTAEKNKLAGIASGAEVNVQADWSETGTTSDAYIKNKPTIPTVNNGALTITTGSSASLGSFSANQSSNTTITLHKVAATGSYNDLTNKPTIPAAANNGALTITTATTGIQLGNFSANQSTNTTVTLHKVAATGSYNDLTNKPTIGNGQITIQTGATPSLGSFSANQTGNTTITLHKVVQTGNVGDLTNNAGYITTANTKNFITSAVTAMTNYATSANVVTALSGKTSQTIDVTYSELVQLKNNSALIPGQSYRITDYLTTTTQNNTSASGMHMKLIVVAESKYNLNHYAVDESGKLQIWYDIENDRNKYAWADSANGRGVIYRMIDEFGNDCPYDFKTILFKRKLNPNNQNQYDPINGVDTWVKTFHSTSMNQWFHNNIIKRYVVPNPNNNNDYIASLNDIVLIGARIMNNFFDDCCHNNTLLDGCKNNIFGNYCINNILSSDTSYNIFGNYCANNVVKDSGNIFGNRCSNNTINYSSTCNTFENECTNNTLGISCSYNTFGNGCQYNTLGDNSQKNTFGNYSTNITFGNGSNQYGTFIENVIIGNGCRYIKLYNSDAANKNNILQNICISPGVQGAVNNYIEISTISRNLAYATKIAKNSNGVLKIYNEADLVL